MKRLAFLTAVALVVLLVAAGAAAAAYQFQTSWGSAGSAAGQFTNPGLLAVAPDGSVYVPDTGNNRVQKFTADGAFLLAFGGAGGAAGQFQTPTAVAVGPDGSVYVVDAGNNRVQRFDASGAFIGQWGSSGPGDGQFLSPTGIAAGPDGSVYVADQGNARVEKFLADGTFLQSFTSGAGGFSGLAGVAVGPDGSVYVVDTSNARVERFDANGLFQNAWGSAGSSAGQFSRPNGIAASAAGIYVADGGNNRVEKFTSGGAFVDILDGGGSGDTGFATPGGIAISPTGLVYLSQPGAARIARYSESGGANLPPPVTGVSANAEPVSGTVKVKVPGRTQFVVLSSGQQIPIGSIIDVRKGTIDLTTTADQTTTQTARFYAGVFRLTQTKAAKPVTELQLYGGNFKRLCRAPAKPASASRAGKRKQLVRELWGAGKGRFRTKGRYASAAIRGTQWLTQDRCDGTRVAVAEGSVTVRDFVRATSLVVAAPQSYFAAAPARGPR